MADCNPAADPRDKCPGRHDRVDQGQMRECLRAVAKVLSAVGVDFFGVQVQGTGQRQQLFAQAPRALPFTDQGQGRDEPERADRKGSLLPFQAVIGCFDAVAEHQAITGKLIGDRQDGTAYPLVVRCV
jgi:hypothetical protein